MMGEVFLLFWWLGVVAGIIMLADYVLFSVFEKEKAEQVVKFFLVAGALAGFFLLFRFVNEHLLGEIMVFYETFF